jgi:hypothetical protein
MDTITELFCPVDDFCIGIQKKWQLPRSTGFDGGEEIPQSPSGGYSPPAPGVRHPSGGVIFERSPRFLMA